MSVSIVQTCDGCGQKRYLKVSQTGMHRNITEASNGEGWRGVEDSKHICPKCIKAALSQKKHGL